MNELANLSGDWRKSKDDHLAEKYRAILRALVFIGYKDELPVELELPEALMPTEYLDQFRD